MVNTRNTDRTTDQFFTDQHTDTSVVEENVPTYITQLILTIYTKFTMLDTRLDTLYTFCHTLPLASPPRRIRHTPIPPAPPVTSPPLTIAISPRTCMTTDLTATITTTTTAMPHIANTTTTTDQHDRTFLRESVPHANIQNLVVEYKS
eukprot:Lankesteria_metandrocarpae@DN8630_c0_g1_i1.p1